MTTAPQLHPDSQAYLDELARLSLPAGTVEQVRSRYRTLCARFAGPPAPVARIEDIHAGAPARLYTTEPTAPLLVWFHGGRMISGGLDTHDPLCRLLAYESGWRVLSVDYRLAPEHPFPAAVDDAMNALQAASTISARVAIGGDSAGASLALGAALSLPGVASAVVLVYPMIDATRHLPSHDHFCHGPGTSSEDIAHGYELWLPPGADPRDPRVSPLFAPDLAGLPPVFLLAAGVDPLRAEAFCLAGRLDQAGVAVRGAFYEGHIHGFLTFPGRFAAVRDALRRVARFLKEYA